MRGVVVFALGEATAASLFGVLREAGTWYAGQKCSGASFSRTSAGFHSGRRRREGYDLVILSRGSRGILFPRLVNQRARAPFQKPVEGSAGSRQRQRRRAK
jgi:hypothetical protein